MISRFAYRTLSTMLAVSMLAAVALALPHPAAAVPAISSLAPERVVFGRVVTVSGIVAPALPGEQIQLEQRIQGTWKAVGEVAVSDEAGAWASHFKPLAPGPVRATQLTGELGSSPETAIQLVPKVLIGRHTSRGPVYPFLGTGVRWRIAPASYPNGRVSVKLSIDGRSVGKVTARIRNGVVTTKLPTRGVGRFRAQLVLPGRGGFAARTSRSVSFVVRGERVGPGSNATWNRSLRAALRFRGVHVPTGRSFDSRMGDSVIAFHKAYGRSRTSTFEASDWKHLTRSAVKVKYRGRGTHIEIDKRRQILMQVRNGKPTMIVHVSTGSTGNTPAGRHSVLWKGEWVPSLYGGLLYKSMAIRGAYAIHGYPSVPTSPASHGCIRVPMWIAATLYSRSPVGMPVYIYEGPGAIRPSLGRRSRDLPELTGVSPQRWADTRGPVTAMS
ncbi:MAG: L,D-transpeptidase [Gaiellales bacterium]